MVGLDTYVDCSLGATGAWTDIDLSATCPEGTTLVAILIQQTHADPKAVGLRNNGSTDSRTPSVSNGQTMFYVGCDENRVIEGYIASTDVNFYLAGYWTTDAYARTNGVDYSLGSGPSGTVDINCSAMVGAWSTAIFEVSGGAGQDYAFRKNGSTDDRYSSTRGIAGVIIGVDGSKICEGAISSTDIDFFGLGMVYLMDCHTNATDVSVGTAASYQDIDVSADSALHGKCAALIEVIGGGNSFGFREKGSGDDYYMLGHDHVFYTTSYDASGVYQIKVGSLACDQFCIGHFADASNDVAVTEDFTFTEDVDASQILYKAVTETVTFTEVVGPLEIYVAVAEDITLTDSAAVRKSYLTVTYDSRVETIVTFDSRVE